MKIQAAPELRAGLSLSEKAVRDSAIALVQGTENK